MGYANGIQNPKFINDTHRVEVGGRERVNPPNPLLRHVGFQTADNFTDPGNVDVTVGQGAIIDFGPVTRQAVGQYEISWQAAADGDEFTPGLGTKETARFDIVESTAGVFVTFQPIWLDGGVSGDSATTSVLLDVGEATLNTDAHDSSAAIFVATAANVGHAAAWTAPVELTAGNLYLLDAISTDSRKWAITRLG